VKILEFYSTFALDNEPTRSQTNFSSLLKMQIFSASNKSFQEE
jgi:hypothetical protein